MRDFGGKRSTPWNQDAKAADVGPAPGKRTLTEMLPPASGPELPPPEITPVQPKAAASTPAPATPGGPRPTLHDLFGRVQRKAAGAEPDAEALPAGGPQDMATGASPLPHAETGSHPHAAAVRGAASPATRLPFADQIQRLFGRHDISTIQAHTGGEAAASARAMGARAFATGEHVVLGDGADLHTVAHEAAHVIQQRAGVRLRGGVGEIGDVYEQHADEVADLVVAGRSAEAALDRMSGGQRAATSTSVDDATPVQGVFVYSHTHHAIGGSVNPDTYYEQLGFISVRSHDGYWVWTDERNSQVVTRQTVPPLVHKRYAMSKPGKVRLEQPQVVDVVDAPLPIQHVHSSCYLASVLTLLASVPRYRDELFNPAVNVLPATGHGHQLQQQIHPMLLAINVGPQDPFELERQVGRLGRDGFPQSIKQTDMLALIQRLAAWNLLDGGEEDQQSAPEIMSKLLNLVHPTRYAEQRRYFPRTQQQLNYDQGGVGGPRDTSDLRQEQFQHLIEIPAARYRSLEDALVGEFPRAQRIDTQTMGTPVNNPHNNRHVFTSFPEVLSFSVAHESDVDAVDMPAQFMVPDACFTRVRHDQQPPYYKLRAFIAHSNPNQDLSGQHGHYVAYAARDDDWYRSDDLGGHYNHAAGVNNPAVQRVDVGRDRYPGHRASTFALGSVYTYERIGAPPVPQRIGLGPLEIDDLSDVHRDKLIRDFSLLAGLLPSDARQEDPALALHDLVKTAMTTDKVAAGLYDRLLALQGTLSKRVASGGSPLERTQAQVALSACTHSMLILVHNGVGKSTMKPVALQDTPRGTLVDSAWQGRALTWRDVVTEPVKSSVAPSVTTLDAPQPASQDDARLHEELTNKLNLIRTTHVGIDLPPELRAELLFDDLLRLHATSGSKKPFAEFVHAKLDALVPPVMPAPAKDETLAKFLQRIPDEADRKILIDASGRELEGLLQMLLGFDLQPLTDAVARSATLKPGELETRLITTYCSPKKRLAAKDLLPEIGKIAVKYGLLDNIASDSMRRTIKGILKIKDHRVSADAFVAAPDEEARLAKLLGQRASDGIIGSVATRAHGLTGARGKIELISRVEAKLKEFEDGPPLTSTSLVLDTNAMRLFIYHHEKTEMNYRDRGVFSHLVRIIKERGITEICMPNMAYIETANHYPSILSMSKVVVAGKVLEIRGVPVDVARSDTAYENTYKTMETAKVGGGKENSSADITIVNDSVHAKVQSGQVPVFATNDRGIVDALWQLARAKIPGAGDAPPIARLEELRQDILSSKAKQVDTSHPDYQYEPRQVSFDLTEGGKTINVVPVGDSVSQYFEPLTKEQKDLKTARDGTRPYQDLFEQMPLGHNWLLGDLFAMIRAAKHDVWVTGGAVRNLEAYLQKNHTTVGMLQTEAGKKKRLKTDWWQKLSKDLFRDIDLVTTMTDTALLAALAKDPRLSSVHMEHEALRHKVNLAGGQVEISCSKEAKSDGEVDLNKVAMGQDFTMNSLFYRGGEIHDPTGSGREDLRDQHLKFSSHAIAGEQGLIGLLHQQPYLLGRLIKFVKQGHAADKQQLKVLIDHFASAIGSMKATSSETASGADVHAIKMILIKSNSQDANALTEMMLKLGFSMDDVRLVLPGEQLASGGYAGWVTPGLEAPTIVPNWSAPPDPDVRLNLETGRVMSSRVYCRDDAGTPLVVDTEYRADPKTREEVPYYRVWRRVANNWTDRDTGLSESGQRGTAPIEHGVYIGRRPWLIKQPPQHSSVKWLKQHGVQATQDGDLVDVGGAITLHVDALDSILKKDVAQARKFVTLVQNDASGMRDGEDANLSLFTGKKDNYRLRFTAMLSEIEQFAAVCQIDLRAKPLDAVAPHSEEGLRARIRMYDLLAARQSPAQLATCHRYAMARKPASVHDYVDHFEFALSHDLRRDGDAEVVEALWRSIDAAAMTGTVALPGFFDPSTTTVARQLMIEAQRDQLGFGSASSAIYHFSKHGDEVKQQLKLTTALQPDNYMHAARSPIALGFRQSAEYEQTGDYAVSYRGFHIRTVIRIARAGGSAGVASIATSYVMHY